MRKLILFTILLILSLSVFAQNEVKGDSIIIGRFSRYREPIKWEKPKKGFVYEYNNLGRGAHSLGLCYHYDWEKYSSDSYWESNSYQTSFFLLSNGKSIRLRAENFPTMKGEENLENLGKLSSMIELSYAKERGLSLYGEIPNLIGLTYFFSFRGSFGLNSTDYRINGSPVWYNSLPKNWFSLRVETPIPIRIGKVTSLTRITWVEGVFESDVTAASWISTEIRWGRIEMKGSIVHFWDNASDSPPANLVGNVCIRIFL